MNLIKKSFLAIYLLLGIGTCIAQNKNTKTETFKVFGTCEQCKKRIEKTVNKLGVNKSNWEIKTNILTISFDSLKLTKIQIQKKLAKVGHDTEEFQADSISYQNLPACCYYDRYIKKRVPEIKKDSTKIISTIKGLVLDEDKQGQFSPIVGAIIKCLSSNKLTTTDTLGIFNLDCTLNLPIKISVNYIGFETDTITIESFKDLKIILKNSSSTKLNEVIINGKKSSTFISSLSTLNTVNITSKELVKAACCNLSESFETSPSIDVNYTDAVIGVKQIQLLGLSSNYAQITTENAPEIKGLAGNFGLTLIPGTWIEGIQVTKGTGSVVNGYESISGQINIEEKKSDKMENIFVNGYLNSLGRMETSVNLSKKINSNWSTALLSHANGVSIKNDNNRDGFLDIPLGQQFNVMNRWKYVNNKGIVAQFTFKALSDNRIAGENDFNPATDKLTKNKYGIGINVSQYIFTGKLGYVFPNQKYKSIGLIISGNTFNTNSYYGLTKYNGSQKIIYANMIYQSIIYSTIHKYRVGLNVSNENYNEIFNDAHYSRFELDNGAFLEYTYNPLKKFTAIVGLRIDYHNQYGIIKTPRLHLKYDFTSKTNLRLSGGTGFRTANIFAENTSVFVSSRKYTITNPSNKYAYGLNPEKAWNYGLNLVHDFELNKRKGTLSIDAYRTDFKNQVVVDLYSNAQEVNFYNLSGKSYSNSLQSEINYELLKKLDIRLAYRWLDVKSNYNDKIEEKPLIAQHRSFVNLAYETNNNWKFDLTLQWFSKKRLPNTATNPLDKQMSTYSPSFTQIMTQISKKIGKKWDVYIGVENLTNYTQKTLFIDKNNPFDKYFDSSLIWGPVNGRIIYIGMRLKL